MEYLGYYNGKYGPLEEMTIPMLDRVCYFGDGVYDATYSRNYKIFTLDEHVDRFFNSAGLLEIPIPHTKEEVKSILLDMVSKMDTGENFVYFQCTRGTGIRNHIYPDPEKVPANFWITLRQADVVPLDTKVKLITLEDTRFLHCNIKTLNLLPACVANEKAKRAGADEVIFYRLQADGRKRVTECAHSNCHIIKDGVFITAPTDHLILPGIARMNLIKACKALGIPVDETVYYIDDVFTADEVLISSAGTFGITATELDGKPVGGKAPEIMAKLHAYLWNQWLTDTNV
ncbi:MAG: aminotransferase class IV [Oscillospiraceae bacterium]|jgi:D-alanine transaminase|nr:aminotransferase class IV [Oscillospiraceae bacterium]